ncbi:MAG TPA: nucleoside triphosphate pyrophosphohydrolase [bacterium]
MDEVKGSAPDHGFAALVDLMARLRAPGGCPWDRKQTAESLKPYIIEEAYELVAAIEHGDPREICDELGDLLLQVVFQARVAEDAGQFAIADVVRAIHDKLVRRHPHVFGDATAADAAEVVVNWELIKQKEKAGRSVVEGVDPRLPALQRAWRMQKKVAKVGFDWERPEGALEKLHEELEEFRVARERETPERAEEEMGDALFALANVARLAGINPEEALKKASAKFERRFRAVEEGLRAQGIDPGSATLEQMEALWQQSKGGRP